MSRSSASTRAKCSPLAWPPSTSRGAPAASADLRLAEVELQGLQVEDIELFEEGRWGLIHVRRSWDRLAGLTEPKSTAGIRSVPVCEQLYEILDEHLLRVAWSEGFAFGRTATTPFAYGAARWQAESAYAKAGLQPSDLQLHECRHSFSSWLAAAGVPLERRNLYRGHADLSMDARYTHMVDHQYLDDARALGDYLRRADSPARIEHATGARTGAQVAETA